MQNSKNLSNSSSSISELEKKLQAAIYMATDIPYELGWEDKISQFWQNSFLFLFPSDLSGLKKGINGLIIICMLKHSVVITGCNHHY